MRRALFLTLPAILLIAGAALWPSLAPSVSPLPSGAYSSSTAHSNSAAERDARPGAGNPAVFSVGSPSSAPWETQVSVVEAVSAPKRAGNPALYSPESGTPSTPPATREPQRQRSVIVSASPTSVSRSSSPADPHAIQSSPAFDSKAADSQQSPAAAAAATTADTLAAPPVQTATTTPVQYRPPERGAFSVEEESLRAQYGWQAYNQAQLAVAQAEVAANSQQHQ